MRNAGNAQAFKTILSQHESSSRRIPRKEYVYDRFLILLIKRLTCIICKDSKGRG